jgi:hypothetical protein
MAQAMTAPREQRAPVDLLPEVAEVLVSGAIGTRITFGVNVGKAISGQERVSATLLRGPLGSFVSLEIVAVADTRRECVERIVTLLRELRGAQGERVADGEGAK